MKTAEQWAEPLYDLACACACNDAPDDWQKLEDDLRDTITAARAEVVEELASAWDRVGGFSNAYEMRYWWKLQYAEAGK